MFICAAKGKVPPAFTLKDQDGKTVSLSKFKGKHVVLYFYLLMRPQGAPNRLLQRNTNFHTHYLATRVMGSAIRSVWDIAWKTDLCSGQEWGGSTHLQQPVPT
ncbi:hypothetical protein L3X38_024416 [Prunus dulcis]|uniref:Peroxiredoxin Q, chloroplastic n=1 Tax=Prunus dulcis TaxID=3755 RepID=A0AAD4Z712_PRUDU|nr:hypothetical protein L3X38_024416 [Prunus dulcis]